MKKISVIVPVYNAEATLAQCVRSLIGQTEPDWEVLLIDDGSTDRSFELCEEWSRTDSRIRAIHQENQGVSAARNYGLALAGGAYVFFLDSDDAIHPLLFEEMLRQMEEHHVKMAFCNCARVSDRQMEAALEAASLQDPRPQWQIGDGEQSERWFHIDHAAVLCGVSGMILRELIGPLRFDEALPFGEDTIFKYELFRKQVRAAYTSRQWYYYRTKPGGFAHRDRAMLRDVYTEKTIRIRDSEFQNGSRQYALIRETELTCQLRQRYESSKKMGSRDECGQIKTLALRECGHPLFPSVDLLHRGLFYLCFYCFPLYVPVSRALEAVWTIRERDGKNR